MPASKNKKKSSVKKQSYSFRTEKKNEKEKKQAVKKPGGDGENKQGVAKLILTQTTPPVIAVVALLILLCLLAPSSMGWFGKITRNGLFGLLGCGAYTVPVLMTVLALTFRKDVAKKTAGMKLLYAPIVTLLVSSLLQLWANPGNPHNFDVALMWENGVNYVGGGALGGLVCEALYVIFGAVGTPIIAIVSILLLVLLLVNLTPYTVWHALCRRIRIHQEELALREQKAREEDEKYKEMRKTVRRAEAQAAKEKKQYDKEVKKSEKEKARLMEQEEEEQEEILFPTDEPEQTPVVLTKDIPISIYGNAQQTEQERPAPVLIDEETEEEKLPPIRMKKKLAEMFAQDPEPSPIESLDEVISDEVMASFKQQQSVRQEGGEVDENGLIRGVDTETGEVLEGEDEFALAIKRLSAMEGILPATEEEEPPVPYELPSVDLLKPNDNPRDQDVSEELNTNAARLVDTLRSFRVKTKIVAISRGPAITRYELAPEEGVKVRSIANLVDDIALNLATTGVRIEAPIPGKSAVGVEVPNKAVEKVALRDLIDSPTFRNATSLTMVSLGMDVAGAPIYLDIAKMPHLLIAGTTGSGKSVCINCMLVSLLFRASPDEVKMIMIDPKKVEFNIYNGLPHLLVPVVSDPKKAAGALHWAVTEMERRFELIEAARVRDLKHYNMAAEKDPSMEKLPHIVIAIDELADLMMTSRDEVETSICRIAQKARAAGMHLIIGTQRPSVNVVTGVIKANIPSRIALKVAGQADSRVILDMNGAEKLIGYGDMLYAPVGCAKPIRVQGAFVSDEEIDAIVSFIKGQGNAHYDASVINSIDEAAERCGNKKGVGDDIFNTEEGGAPSESDPMLKKAIELAVESGKISTSLIQRRLSLGYGRAAKLIDAMEAMGIVGAPEGQKPRQVLITADQYLEMMASGFGDDFS